MTHSLDSPRLVSPPTAQAHTGNPGTRSRRPTQQLLDPSRIPWRTTRSSPRTSTGATSPATLHHTTSSLSHRPHLLIPGLWMLIAEILPSLLISRRRALRCRPCRPVRKATSCSTHLIRRPMVLSTKVMKTLYLTESRQRTLPSSTAPVRLEARAMDKCSRISRPLAQLLGLGAGLSLHTN